MLKALNESERLLLMKFVCAFAWTDLEVQAEERQFIKRLVERMQLDEGEAAQVEEWLRIPPRPEEIDPARVPREHRQLFLDAAKDLIESDGYIGDNEAELYETLEVLLA